MMDLQDSKRPVVLYCSDFNRATDRMHCCVSCHNDWEDGERHLPSGYWLDTDTREVEVCCKLGQWLEALSDKGEALAHEAEARCRG